MNKKLIVCLLLALPFLAFAQSKVSPLTQIYLNEQGEASSDVQRAAVRKAYNLTTENDVDYVSGFLYFDGAKEDLEALGVLFNSDFDTIFTVQIPTSRIEEVLAFPGVNRFEISQPVHPTMKNARGKAYIDEVYGGTASALTRGYKGAGVAIGVVDIGFQFDHINFYDEARSTTRIKAAWNQNKAGTDSNHPAGYNYGIEYATPTKIIAAKKDGTSETHGTHVAGIAAGSTSLGYRGVAPAADIYLVSTNCSDQGILDGIQYIFKKASNKPCVINLSLGAHVGPHDGTSTFDRLTSTMVGERKILVGSAGNEGSDWLHVTKTLSALDNTMHAELRETYPGYGYADDQYVIDIWGDVDQDFTFSFCIFDPNGDVAYATDPITAFSGKTGNATLRNKTDLATAGTIAYSSEKNSFNNKGNVLLRISSEIKLKSGYYYGFEVTSEQEGTINAWINGSYWSFYHAASSLNGMAKGDLDMSVSEIGGVGSQIISVGSFKTGTSTGSNTSVNSVSEFSSIGPTADGRMKPDVIAPGEVITSSVNNYNIKSKSDMQNYSGYGIYKTEEVEINGTKQTFAYGGIQGTSMSSPFVAGVVALWLENARWMDVNEVRAILQKTSYSDTYTGVCPNNTAGYGKINALAGLLETFTYSSLDEIEASSAELIVYPNPVVDELKVFFPKTDKNVNIAIWGINGQVVYTKQIDNVLNLHTESINFANVPSGMYIIRITGDKTNECFKINK